jgi:hypothetical protein
MGNACSPHVAYAWLRATLRLLWLPPLALIVQFAAVILTLCFVFPNEHPFQTAGMPDHEKLPDAVEAYAALPACLVFGALTGIVLSAGRTTRIDRIRGLLLLGCLLTYLTTTQADPFYFWPILDPGQGACVAVAAGVICLLWPYGVDRAEDVQ